MRSLRLPIAVVGAGIVLALLVILGWAILQVVWLVAGLV